jgi:hypothetical protein
MLLAEHDRFDEAEEAFLRAYERGHPNAAENLAALREYRGSIAVPEPVAVVPPALDRTEHIHERVPTSAGDDTSQPEDDRDEEASAEPPRATSVAPPGATLAEPPRATSVKGSPIRRRRGLAAGLVAVALGVVIVAANVLGTKGANAPRSATVAIEQNAVQPALTRPTHKTQQKPATAQKPPQARAPATTATTSRHATKPAPRRATHASKPAGSHSVRTTSSQDAGRAGGGSPAATYTAPPVATTIEPSRPTSTGSGTSPYRSSSGSGGGGSSTGSPGGGSGSRAGSGTGGSQSQGTGNGGSSGSSGSGTSGSGSSGSGSSGSGTVIGGG